MYWHNPKIRTSERVRVPSDDEGAIHMLAGHPDSGDIRERVRRVTPLGYADRASAGVGGPRGAAEAAPVHAGAASRARVSDQEGEAECHRVQAAFGGAPPSRKARI